MTQALFLDGHVALGFGDPGGINPITGLTPNPITDRWYDLLPEMYRLADDQDTSTAGGWPLYGYMDGAASVLVQPTTIANRIADGHLTDPAVADDAWIPWLAQVTGVEPGSIADMRERLARLVTAPAYGSRAYLEVLTQKYLSGTRSVQVRPLPPWGIEVRVRAAELTVPGADTVDALAAALYATGAVPAGFVLSVATAQQTWGQVQTALPTWAPGEGKNWAQVQTMGLAGAGTVVGGVSWVGAAVGDAP